MTTRNYRQRCGIMYSENGTANNNFAVPLLKVVQQLLVAPPMLQ